MQMPLFDMERMQSTWENVVDYNLAESGVEPVCLRDLMAMGLDMEWLQSTPLGYSQTNGTVELRQAISAMYPGTTVDHIEVTNGTSEANFLVSMVLLRDDDEVVFESPNYMQLSGVPPGFGARVKPFSLRPDQNWEPDWEEFDRALSPKTRLVYVTNPHNPTGSVLSAPAMARIIEAIEHHNAFLLADEVYQGSAFDGRLTPSFWGMSDRVIVTSGLSKAYGIPGVRIGWLVGPPGLVADCWAQHDYVTIGPSILGDMIARVAVREDNRKKLFARGSTRLARNGAMMRRWIDGFDGLLEWIEPRAGAFAFVRYRDAIPSIELAKRIRENQGVLVVPGTQLGLEGYLRIALGVSPEHLEAGLSRIGIELAAIRDGR